MVWYSHLLKNFPQFIVIHTVKGFSIVNKAEVDVFLELSCFSLPSYVLICFYWTMFALRSEMCGRGKNSVVGRGNSIYRGPEVGGSIDHLKT